MHWLTLYNILLQWNLTVMILMGQEVAQDGELLEHTGMISSLESETLQWGSNIITLRTCTQGVK